MNTVVGFILVVFAAILIGLAFTLPAQAYIDKPGYHHCPALHHCSHYGRDGAAHSSDSAIDQRLREDEHARAIPHRHGNSADRETQALVDDYETWMYPEKRPGYAERRQRRERRQRCAGLEMEYRLRHGFGKPAELRGAHGCRLYELDARWHVAHPSPVGLLA